MHNSTPSGRGDTRRQFIKKTGAAITATGMGLTANVFARESQTVFLFFDPRDPLTKRPSVQWAAGELRNALTSRGIQADILNFGENAPRSQPGILMASEASNHARGVLNASQLALPQVPEALVFARGSIGKMPRKVLLAGGSDERGLVYALLELADRVQFAENPLDAFKFRKPVIEQAANPIRSVARGFNSDVEDKSWFNDRAFWSRYLTMLATHRFNRFSLTLGLGYDFTTQITDCYFHFAYPFLLSVPGYEVRAAPLPDAERDANLAMLKFISEETARRGMHFQLGLWTHAYQWTNSPKANYTIEGLTAETHPVYCRDALLALLAACPAINGITFRIHGESGLAEGNYKLWKTIFDGVGQCGRRVEIDMHAKGMDQGMIDVALATGQPVNISPKFWAEHMGLPYMQGAIRQLEMPPPNSRNTGFFSRSSGSRSFLRYGYGDLLAEDRRYGVLHRLWPGTQRLLLWGDPETAAAYGRVSTFCGSLGMELMEPLFFKGRKGSGLPGGRDAYSGTGLKPKDDFEKYDYTYRVWGRSLFNPDGDGDGARRLLQHQFGRGAESAGCALASAGKILPLITTAHCPSAANNNYWPEMYFNMPMVNASRRHPYGDSPSPKRFGTVSPLDPEFFLSCDDYANELLKGEFSGKRSPLQVAEQINAAAAKALVALGKADSTMRNASPEFLRLSLDVRIQADLGKFFAHKFCSAVYYALYLRSGYRLALTTALLESVAARDNWTALARRAQESYRDDITFGPEYFQRGHWSDRLPAMELDLLDIVGLLDETEPKPGEPAPPLKTEQAAIERAVQVVGATSFCLITSLTTKTDLPLATQHIPPDSFKRGQALSLSIQVKKREVAQLAGMNLRYRHVNQAETWQMTEMEWADGTFRAVIAAEYTNSPFPLQYYFQIRTRKGDAWLHPGLDHPWHGQPYYFLSSK